MGCIGLPITRPLTLHPNACTFIYISTLLISSMQPPRAYLSTVCHIGIYIRCHQQDFSIYYRSKEPYEAVLRQAVFSFGTEKIAICQIDS